MVVEIKRSVGWKVWKNRWHSIKDPQEGAWGVEVDSTDFRNKRLREVLGGVDEAHDAEKIKALLTEGREYGFVPAHITVFPGHPDRPHEDRVVVDDIISL